MFSDVLRDLFHSGKGCIRVAAERFFGVPVATLPTAAVDFRGTLARTEGGAGVADRLVLCEKNTSDTYDWNDLGRAALDDRYVNVSGDTMTGAFNVDDDDFTLRDNVDTTKHVQFQLSGITTATTRTYTAPNANGTMALQSQAESLTIASGAITLSGPWVGLVVLDTEAAAATDDLDTINGGTVGQRISINSAIDTREPTIKDGTGNLRLAGDFLLSANNDLITLVYGNPGPVWREASRSDNAA